MNIAMAVNNNPNNLVLLTTLLLRSGVSTAAGVCSDAIEMARRLHPSIIFIDFARGHFDDDIGILRELRAMPETRDTPLIAVSGYVQPSQIQLVFDAGATEFIPKPYTAQQIRDMLVVYWTGGPLPAAANGLHTRPVAPPM
jgi:two-component system, cell cycle response regulator DivK